MPKGAARPDRSVDSLVEFGPGRMPALIGIGAIEIEFGRVLGRKADSSTAQDLSPRFRDDVLRRAEVA